MTLTLTVADVVKTLKSGSLEIMPVQNGTDTLRCIIVSLDGTYRPAVGADVTLDVDSDRVFGGYVVTPRETGAGGRAVTPIYTELSAVGYGKLADDVFVTETVADGTTLKAFLQTLETTYFGDLGITLDASQATGPTLGAMAFDTVTLAEVFDQLAQATDYIWTIDPHKVMSMTATTATPAPFDIAVGDDTIEGDLTVERSRQGYGNRIINKYGDNRLVEQTVAFTGDGVTDTFTLPYPIAGPVPYTADGAVGQAFVTVDSGIESLGGASSTLQWTYDPTTQAITRVAGAPSNGAAISITYNVQYPQTVTVDDAGEQASFGRVVTVLMAEPTVFERAQAIADAETELARRTATITTVTFETRQPGLRPGMLQHITVPQRNIDDDFLITELRMSDVGNAPLRTEVTAVSGAFQFSPWRDQYLRWLGGADAGTAAASTGPAAPSTGGVPSPPDYGTQYRSPSGTFAADAQEKTLDPSTTYGVEDLPALKALMATDESRLALAIGNATAGRAKALTVYVQDDGTQYWELDGADLNLFTFGGGDITIASGANTDVKDKATSANTARLLLTRRVAIEASYYSTQKKTSSFTLDAAFAGGGAPENVLHLTATTGTPVLTLPASSGAPGTVGVLYQRRIKVLNSGTVAWTVAVASGNLNGVASGTYVLLPGQAAEIIASNQSGVTGWWVYGETARVRKTIVTLTDAQIKALPTSAITVIAAPASGFRHRVLGATYLIRSTAGAYTNVDTTYATLLLQSSNGNWLTVPIVNDNTASPALTRLTAALGAGDNFIDVTSYLESSNGWVVPGGQAAITDVNAAAVQIALDNNGSGNLTGGNAANTLTVTVYSALEAL